MPLKILVVDDRPENIFSLVHLIEQSGSTIETASSGQKALALLSRINDIDLALIDVQMPEMDGFELATLMRGVERTRHIPIIFITADVQSSDFEFKGYESGAVDILFKPINSKVLLSKIEVFNRLATKKKMLRQKIEELEASKKLAEDAQKRAEDADRMKSAFLANMSHEMRTPLTALLGFAELLINEDNSPTQQKEYLNIILRNGRNLVDLINDLLDLSKIEAGELTVETIEFSLSALIDEVANLLQPLIEKNEVNLKIYFHEGSKDLIASDLKRVRQVLINLIGNAVKFSAKGSVKVEILKGPPIKIRILDTGIGIPPEKQHLLFKPFHQLVNSECHEYGGTGLGLALSKKIAHALGGDILLLASKVNGGTTFQFQFVDRTPKAQRVLRKGANDKLQTDTLPSPTSSKEIDESELKARIASLVILLIDDSPDNQMLVDTVLRQYGAQVLLASSAQEGIDMALREHVDTVLMDFQLPDLDGLEATRKLRDQDFINPIIFLTANAMGGERDRAIDAGANEYVAKPIHWHTLLTTIVEHNN